MTDIIQKKYHLYQRAEFFVHDVCIDKNSSISEDDDEILQRQNIKSLPVKLKSISSNPFVDLNEKDKRALKKEWRKKSEEINHLWIKQMTESDKGLIEKMTLFWGFFFNGMIYTHFFYFSGLHIYI